MAVRRVSNRGGNIIGKFPSLKMKRMVMFESLIERDYLYLLDYDPDVLQFAEQPLTIPYSFEGKSLTYTPDFQVVRTSGTFLVECKPVPLTHTEENQRKFKAAQNWCTEREWGFYVATDQQIRTGFRLENVKRITYYARLKIRADQRGSVYAQLMHSPQLCTLRDVATVLMPENPALALPILWHMAFHHEVVIPLDEAPLTFASPITLPR